MSASPVLDAGVRAVLLADGGEASAGVAVAFLGVVLLLLAVGFVSTWRQARRRRAPGAEPTEEAPPPP